MKTVIALGFFDGVHLGHGQLLQMAARRARELGCSPAAFTFDRSPKEVVTGQSVPLLNSSWERADIVRRVYGIDTTIIAPFDDEMRTMQWEDFIEKLLVGKFGAVHLVAGHDYRFGYKNAGNVEKLQEKCAEMGIGCDIIPEFKLHDITVSSTYIRMLVESGQMEKAAEYLGHRHCLTQTVSHGRRLGRTIGIPTVNQLLPESVICPKFGVYATRVYLPDGSEYRGVTNVGVKPTVGGMDAPSAETYIIDFSGDLYDKTIRIEFVRYLREEKKFDSLQDLKVEIEKNIEQAKE